MLDLFLSVAEDFARDFDKYLNVAKALIISIIWKTIDFLSFISRPLYILLLVVGIISYTLPINSYKSKKIIWGSILLMIFTEFILPIIRSSVPPTV